MFQKKHIRKAAKAAYASTEEQLRKLKALVFQFWPKWEGPAEFRAAFCALYCPRDGREAYSGLYPQEGYPALDPKLSRLSLNMGGIDRLAPTEERILEWEAQCASPDFAFTQNLLTQAQEHFETKLLPAGERSEPYTAAEVKDFELEHQRRQEEALGILGRAARAAARYGISEQPSEVEIEWTAPASGSFTEPTVSRANRRERLFGRFQIFQATGQK